MAEMMFPTSAASKQTVKVTLGDDMRRFKLDLESRTPASEAFVAVEQAARRTFGCSETQSLKLKYTDDDGDLCTLAQATMEDFATLAAGGLWRLHATLHEVDSAAPVSAAAAQPITADAATGAKASTSAAAAPPAEVTAAAAASAAASAATAAEAAAAAETATAAAAAAALPPPRPDAASQPGVEEEAKKKAEPREGNDNASQSALPGWSEDMWGKGKGKWGHGGKDFGGPFGGKGLGGPFGAAGAWPPASSGKGGADWMGALANMLQKGFGKGKASTMEVALRKEHSWDASGPGQTLGGSSTSRAQSQTQEAVNQDAHENVGGGSPLPQRGIEEGEESSVEAPLTCEQSDVPAPGQEDLGGSPAADREQETIVQQKDRWEVAGPGQQLGGSGAELSEAERRLRVIQAAEQRQVSIPGISAEKAKELAERQQKAELLGKLAEHYNKQRLELPMGLNAATIEQLRGLWEAVGRGDRAALVLDV